MACLHRCKWCVFLTFSTLRNFMCRFELYYALEPSVRSVHTICNITVTILGTFRLSQKKPFFDTKTSCRFPRSFPPGQRRQNNHRRPSECDLILIVVVRGFILLYLVWCRCCTIGIIPFPVETSCHLSMDLGGIVRSSANTVFDTELSVIATATTPELSWDRN